MHSKYRQDINTTQKTKLMNKTDHTRQMREDDPRSVINIHQPLVYKSNKYITKHYNEIIYSYLFNIRLLFITSSTHLHNTAAPVEYLHIVSSLKSELFI